MIVILETVQHEISKLEKESEQLKNALQLIASNTDRSSDDKFLFYMKPFYEGYFFVLLNNY